MDRTGFEVLRGTQNQFKIHWQAFEDEKITLQDLLLLTFSWIIKHEDLYSAKPLPTEPMQYPRVSAEDFKQVVKAWRLGCDSREAENKSNARWLNEAKSFFLKSDNDYKRGIELFVKYEELPF